MYSDYNTGPKTLPSEMPAYTDLGSGYWFYSLTLNFCPNSCRSLVVDNMASGKNYLFYMVGLDDTLYRRLLRFQEIGTAYLFFLLAICLFYLIGDASE